MDLAMHFGMPADELARRMTEREFGQWVRRARTQWLPARRIEWYLAQIAYIAAVAFGGAKDASIRDFTLRFEAAGDDEPEEADLEEAKAFFGFAPRGKKNK